MQRYIAEVFGTFALVFVGTAAIASNDLLGGELTAVGVALAFGLVVMAMVYAIGDISGAHLNPAVTVGFWAAGRLHKSDLSPYILSQCLGAVIASAMVWAIFPSETNLGTTVPTGGLLESFALEIVLTAILMFVILGVSSGAKEKGLMAGIAVGGTVALASLCGGFISGASMNPARSLGPAIVTGTLNDLWLYMVAPSLGAVLAVAAYKLITR